MRKNPTTENVKTYRRHRNFLNLLIKKVKRSYYQEQVSKNKNNPKQLWSCVKDICSVNKKKGC